MSYPGRYLRYRGFPTDAAFALLASAVAGNNRLRRWMVRAVGAAFIAAGPVSPWRAGNRPG